ncbi:MAG: LEA type 2 family protein [Thermoanaerobaculia bacterium]
MRLKSISIAALLAITLIGSGCNTLRDALEIENPTYRIRSVRPNLDLAIPFSASTVDLDFTIDIENPNRVALRLDRLDFDILMNGNRVAQGINNSGIRIPAEGIGALQLETRFGYNELSSLFREVVEMIQGNRASYEIRGTAYYDTPIGQLNFPITVYRAGN